MQHTKTSAFRTAFGVAAALLCLQVPVSAKPAFTELLHNPAWYRTFDTSSSISPSEGTLLYACNFRDADKRPDSFFVGIDTLWGLPQNVSGDTASDWDLQVCPDEICMNGLKAGIHGANSPYPFSDTDSHAEHHFQFFPAIDPGYNFTAPARSIFGAMMFCRSRSNGVSDTVFAFGAWALKWDPALLPPVRPVAGYLPRLSDFAISGDTVRYLKAGSGLLERASGSPRKSQVRVEREAAGLLFSFPEVRSRKRLSIHGADGREIWNSGWLQPAQAKLSWSPGNGPELPFTPGFVFVRLVWSGGEAWAKAALLSP